MERVQKPKKTPLQVAIEEHEQEIGRHEPAMVEIFLEQMMKDGRLVTKKDLARDSNGNNIFHLVVMNDNQKVINFLLESEEIRGFVNGKNDAGETPLHVAARHNAYKSAESLLDAGVTLDEPVPDTKKTALYLAVQEHNYEMVDLLLRYGASKTIKDTEEVSPQMLIDRKYNSRETYKEQRDIDNITKIHERFQQAKWVSTIKSLWERFKRLF